MEIRNRLTEHARIRAQQRGIPLATIEALLEYGLVTHVKGARIFHFHSQRAKRRLKRQLPPDQIKAVKLNAYAVVGTHGHVITVGHRFKRVRH